MPETLETALAAFASSRSSVIGDAIEVLGRAAAAGYTPPKLRTNLEFHRAWLAVAADPALRSWCLDQLTAKLPKLMDGKEHPAGDKLDALLERLAVLAQAAPDPRIARAMLARFELREPVIGFSDAHDAMVRLVGSHADDGTAAAVRGEGLPEELRALELPAPVKLGKADAALWAPLGRAPAPRRDLATLWRAVADAPDDDTPRAVLADALQEQGDPRGELIAIQLAEARGQATDEAIARATELVKTHGRDWLGALRPVIYRAELRRGFLARLELGGSWTAAKGKWEQHARDPLLATVEEIEPGQANSATYAQFLASPVVRANLRGVEISNKETFAAVTASPLPRLARVGCHFWKRGSYEDRFLGDVVPFVERTPTVTTVGCDLELVTKLPKAVVARLVGFECTHGELADVVALWKKWSHLRTLRCDELELVRAEGGDFARYRPTTFFKGDGAELLGLPKSIRRLEIIGNAAFVKRATPVLGKRFELVVRPLPSGLVAASKA